MEADLSQRTPLGVTPPSHSKRKTSKLSEDEITNKRTKLMDLVIRELTKVEGEDAHSAYGKVVAQSYQASFAKMKQDPCSPVTEFIFYLT